MIDTTNDLSPEDNFQLNVLLSQSIDAIRLNESKLILYAFMNEKEVSLKLSPNCHVDQYIKKIKECLSTRYLKSPAGYPVFLKRWTRTGEMKSDNIDNLLRIAEPEAIVAITHSDSITIRQANFAWWANPSTENAQQLLSNSNIAKSGLSTELSAFLLEFLPFETSSESILNTMDLLLSNNLISDQEKSFLWKKGKRKAVYLIGFLQLGSEYLLENSNQKNDPAHYARHCIDALNRFSDADSILSLYHSIPRFFNQLTDKPENLQSEEYTAAQLLKTVDPSSLNLFFARNNAVGSLLRKKLKVDTEKIIVHLKVFVKE